MIRWLYLYITTPSRFDGDPRGYLLNQLGHAWIVGAPIGWICGEQFLTGVLYYAVAIELPQLLFWRGRPSDGVEDTLHVALGAFAVSFGLWSIVAIQLASVLAGTLYRAGR